MLKKESSEGRLLYKKIGSEVVVSVKEASTANGGFQIGEIKSGT